MSAVRRSCDQGFTLVELLIAIVIMGISIAVFVVALGSLSVATENHRGHSVNETVVRDFAEAISAKATYSTTLAAAVTDTGSGSICITGNPSNFGSTVVGMYLTVDSETMQVTGSPGNCSSPASAFKLNVNRGVGSIPATHLVNSIVRQFTACPSASTPSSGNRPNWIGYLNPDGAYSPPSGVTATILPIGNTYLDPMAATPTYDWSQTQCFGYFTTHCADPSSNFGPNSSSYDLLPECDPGLVLITLQVTDTNVGDGAAVGSTNCANGALCTTTQMLVRRAGH